MSQVREVKENKNTKKYSISRQISRYMVFIAFAAILVSFIFNAVFITGFSVIRRENVLAKAYNVLSATSKTGELYEDDYNNEFETLCSNENLQVLICDASGNVLRSSQGSKSMMIRQLYNSMLSRDEDNRVLVKSSSDYSILKLKDPQFESEFLVLWGTLPDSNLILIRSGLGSIKQSMHFTSRVLLAAGVIAVLIAWVVSIFLSQRVTEPVVRLTKISKQMTELDFNAKYVPGKKPNEIDDLGIHMNELSEKLEKTIQELVKANNDLQRDLDWREEKEKMRGEFWSGVS